MKITLDNVTLDIPDSDIPALKEKYGPKVWERPPLENNREYWYVLADRVVSGLYGLAVACEYMAWNTYDSEAAAEQGLTEDVASRKCRQVCRALGGKPYPHFWDSIRYTVPYEELGVKSRDTTPFSFHTAVSRDLFLNTCREDLKLLYGGEA